MLGAGRFLQFCGGGLVGAFCFGPLLRRLERVEKVLMGEGDQDAWLVGLGYFDCIKGGIFGHSNLVYGGSGQVPIKRPCTDEEEIELMRIKYDDFHHKFFGEGDELTFPDFLELFFYLSPNVPDDRKRSVVQKLREKE